MKNLKLYVRALRLPFITASALLVIFTGLYVYTSQGIFNWNLFLLTLLGVSFAHLASNFHRAKPYLSSPFVFEKNGSKV